MTGELLRQWPLALMWVVYCGLHSLLATRDFKAAVTRRWPSLARRYRLTYNIVALATLAPLLAWHLGHPGAALWAWQGAAAWVANGLALLALLGFRQTTRHYDLAAFLGLRPGPTNSVLCLSPLHRHVRHPWYSLGLILIWSRDMDAAMLVSALCVTLYLVLGSRREERDLIAEFGDAYRQYRQLVPALIPWPGRSLSAAEARRLATPSNGTEVIAPKP